MSVNVAPCGKGKRLRHNTDGQMGEKREDDEERGVMCADPSTGVRAMMHTLQAHFSGSRAAGRKLTDFG